MFPIEKLIQRFVVDFVDHNVKMPSEIRLIA